MWDFYCGQPLNYSAFQNESNHLVNTSRSFIVTQKLREEMQSQDTTSSRLGCSCALGTCIDDVNKLRLEGGSAHQEAIHIVLGAQLFAVGPRHGAWRREGLW